MAKLKPIPFRFQAKTGELLEFRSEATVSDTSGTFALTIPDELEQVALKISGTGTFRVAVSRPKLHLRVEGASLDECKRFIHTVGTEYLECEVIQELVLIYNTAGQVGYVKDDEGKLYPNGYSCSEKYQAGEAKWCGELHATKTSKFYQVGISARIFNKVTYKRASGVLVEYQRVDSDSFERGSWGEKLNRFVGLEFPFRNQSEFARFQQMPYTEQAAEFFYGMLISMCALADRLDTFMGTHDRVLAAIQNHAGLLAAPKE